MVPTNLEIEAKALQSDGKIVAVGFFVTEDDSSPFVVARFHPDGKLDSSFHGTGIVTTKVGSCDDHAAGVGVQSDGKILVVGTSYNLGQASEITVLRYDSYGNLDPEFGDLGIVQMNLSSGYDQGHALVLQDDGTVVVVTEAGAPRQWGILSLGFDGRRVESLVAPVPTMAW